MNVYVLQETGKAPQQMMKNDSEKKYVVELVVMRRVDVSRRAIHVCHVSVGVGIGRYRISYNRCCARCEGRCCPPQRPRGGVSEVRYIHAFLAGCPPSPSVKSGERKRTRS